MAVVWIDGFDQYASTKDAQALYGAVEDRTSNLLISLQPGRTGGQSLYAGNGDLTSYIHGAYVTSANGCPSVLFDPSPDITVGCGFLPSYANYNNGLIASCIALRRKGEVQIKVWFNASNRRVEAVDHKNNTLLGSTDFRWYPNRWYFLEVRCRAASGDFEVRIDEVTVLSGNGTLNTSDGVYDELVWGAGNTAGNGYNAGVDDLYILDNSLDGANGFLGDLTVSSLVPIADRKTSWTANPNNGTGGNYKNVDDQGTLNDADYNQSSTSGDQDAYELSKLATDPSSIPAIGVQARVQKDLPGTRSVRVGIEDAAGKQSMGAARALSTEWVYYSHVDEKAPSGEAWSRDSVNGTAFVIEAV